MQFPLFSLASIFAELGNSSGSPAFTHALIHAKLTIAIRLLRPSTLLPHTTHSHFIISASKEAISTVFANFLISLFLLNSNKKVIEASPALYFWDHHTPIQTVAKPTEELDTALVYFPVLKPGGLQKPRIVKVHHNFNSLRPRWNA